MIAFCRRLLSFLPVVLLAGLMAAETALAGGLDVALYDSMPSVGRKFLLAGKGGLNLTHSDPAELFLSRYGDRRTQVAPWLAEFGSDAVRAWAQGLGIDTYVGSSGRVFPRDMKAAPLLRAWLARLASLGVEIRTRHRWLGLEMRHDGRLEVSVADQDGVESGDALEAVREVARVEQQRGGAELGEQA